MANGVHSPVKKEQSMTIEPKRWHSIIAIIAGVIAIGSATLTTILRLSPFATNEAMAAANKKIDAHDIYLGIFGHKVDRLDEKLDNLNDTWNRHIQLEHG